MIDALDINGVLNRYFGKADTFVLVSAFNRGRVDEEPYRRKYPYGKYKLSKSDADNAFEAVDKYTKRYLRRVYDEDLSVEQKATLPSFESLCEEIKSECIAHDERRKRGELGEKESPFACDLVYEGNVKYSKPVNVFWHFYHSIGCKYCGEDNYCEMLEKLTSNSFDRPLDYELRKPPYSELLPHLISVTPTFIWHCTRSGGLHKEFRFGFNETTRAWLAEHFKFNELSGIHNTMQENDCYKYGLEDLAFYDGDKLLFSQCTHEGFQNDYLERFDD